MTLDDGNSAGPTIQIIKSSDISTHDKNELLPERSLAANYSEVSFRDYRAFPGAKKIGSRVSRRRGESASPSQDTVNTPTLRQPTRSSPYVNHGDTVSNRSPVDPDFFPLESPINQSVMVRGEGMQLPPLQQMKLEPQLEAAAALQQEIQKFETL